MKTINKLMLMSAFLFILSGIICSAENGQTILKSLGNGIDHKVQKGSTVTLQIQEHRGTLQWQHSTNGISWSNWEGKTGEQIQFTANEDNFIRVGVISENCDPVYSETVHVIVITGPMVVTAEVTRIAATEAYSGGEVTPGEGLTVTEWGVCWSTSENPTIDDSIIIDEEFTPENFRSCLSGLDPNTTYYVRAFATSSDGTGYGEQFSFTTEASSGSFTDNRDQREYQWVFIGPQKWMAANLAWVPAISPPTEGSDTDKQYYVYGYQGSSISEAKETENYSKYGVLYNSVAAQEECPEGWHLPGDMEWKILERYLGMGTTEVNTIGTRASGSVGGKLKEAGTDHWKSPNGGADNSTGFTALPGGARHTDGTFVLQGEYAFFWSSPYTGDTTLRMRNINSTGPSIGRFNEPGHAGFSVRCIQDAAAANTPPTAAFTIDPAEGSTETRFAFDAMACADSETNRSDLEVRWDFDGDGTWDTDFSPKKILIYQYAAAGTYTVLLEVIDSRGLTDTISKTITIT